jgi:uncharacterized protein YecT (DUF1311 family)
VWKVSDSAFAPWIDFEKNRPKDTTTLDAGSSTIVFRANRIEAPAPLACNTPKYELKTVSADQIFEGRLKNPVQDAKDFGLDAKGIVMLDTGCGVMVYFVDPYKAVFDIADWVYTIERDPPPGVRPDDRERMKACMKLVADNSRARRPVPEPFLSEMPTAAGRLDTASSEARFETTSCIGAIAYPCIAKQNYNGGRVACYYREHAFWDDRLNAAYKRLIAKSEPAVAASYRKIQRAWVTYRDARCAHPQIEFQGTMARPMEAACQMQTTADQSLWLGSEDD